MKNRCVRTFFFSLVGALVIALGLSIFTATSATTSFYYSVTNLGTFNGYMGSTATGINDEGQVVGYAYKMFPPYSPPIPSSYPSR